MATKFTQIVGQPFSKPVRAEFERRRSLDQNYDTISELYQPYFKIRRLKSLQPVTSMRTPEEDDYMTGRFSSLGKVYDEGEYDIGYGMDSLEEDSELKGYPAITSVTFELEDFTFYRATINFEIPDITYFQEFREKWLQFGAPIEMEWGRYSPVEFEEDSNEDILPNLEKRMGNVVKFDYGMDGGGKEITGTLTVYSVTWLPVLQEGTSEEHESEEFKKRMKYLHKEIFRNPVDILSGTDYGNMEIVSQKLRNFAPLGNPQSQHSHLSIAEAGKAITDQENNDEVNVRDLLWGVVKRGKTRGKVQGSMFTGGNAEGSSFTTEAQDFARVRTDVVDRDEELSQDFFEKEVYKIIERDYSNVKNVEEFINCHFDLDSKEYGTDKYHFISFRMIEILLNSVMSGNRVRKRKGIFEGDLFHFNLTGSIINNISFRGIRSRMPDSVIINPRDNRYIQNEDGEIIRNNSEGELYLSGDIFVSATDFYRLIDQSKNAYSFVSNLLEHVKNATAGIIDLEQKREDGIVENGNIIINGIGLIDSSQIKDNGTDNYITFNLHHPKEKLQNFSLNTEIADDISNMIFFRSRENIEDENDGEVGDLNEVFLFSDQYNLWHFIDKFEEDYGEQIRDDIKALTYEGAKFHRFPEIEEKYDVEIHEGGRVTINGLKNVHNMDLYEVRKGLLDKFERKFDDINAKTKQRTIENIDEDSFSDENYINVGKDYIINALSYIYIYMSQEVEKGRVEFYSNNNFRIPYTVSFEVDGIAGIIPSQAFKVDLTNFPVEYTDQESALFVVTGLSHTFEGNSWVTTINGSFWIDFKTTTFLNKHKLGSTGDLLTTEYTNMLSAMQIIFTEKITENLKLEKDFYNLLRTMDFKGYIESNGNILEFVHPAK